MRRSIAALCATLALAACLGDPPLPPAAGDAPPRDPVVVDANARRAVLERSFHNLMGAIGEEEVAAIHTALLRQQDAWNAGDIEGFMDGYWRSPDLRFASGDDVTTGWAQTLRRYDARYPDPAAMGELAFSDLDIGLVAPDAAFVFGRWRLIRETDQPHGLFTLIFRKVDGAWVIAHDHTSSAD